jgi:hypothetical protein
MRPAVRGASAFFAAQSQQSTHRSFVMRTIRRARSRKITHATNKRKGTPRPLPPHRTYTAELTENVRRRYEGTPEPVIHMAADLGIHPSSVHRLARSRGWVRRNQLPARDLSPALRLLEQAKALAAGCGAAADEAVDASCERAPTPPSPEQARPPAAPPVAISQSESPQTAEAAPPALPSPSAIERLERAVLAELATIEAMRAAFGTLPQSPRDAERTVRTLGLLSQTLQQLQRMRVAAPSSPFGTDHDDDLPADIDAFRDELARRIDAFVASRTGAAGARGDAADDAVDAPAS